MTSVEIPYSIAAALPSLVVLDITNDIERELSAGAAGQGIAFVSSGPDALVRVNERESGFFTDLEALLARLVPLDRPGRTQLLALLLGARTEQVPFDDGRLCLGRWQRLLLFGFGESVAAEWKLTILGC
jgi:thiamine phosphate synthase YjbQ (UPF0047 family)